MARENIYISVIIPCFNCSKWIEKCLKALESQIFTDFEVICIDDCSTDNTMEVISSIKESSLLDITILHNSINQGPAKSRNKAISIAKGKYLAFCDSDDWYEDDFLEKMYYKLVDHGANLVMCNYRKVFESGRVPEAIQYLPNKALSNEEYMVYSKSSLCLLMFESHIIDDLIIPDLRNGEDVASVPCIEVRAKKIVAVNEVLYNYRIRRDSCSNRVSPKVFESLSNAFRFIEDNCTSEYKNALEYIGIKTVLYGAIVNGLKAKTNRSQILNSIEDFERKYPDWYSNRYLCIFPRTKRIFLFCIKHKALRLAYLIAKVHEKVSV